MIEALAAAVVAALVAGTGDAVRTVASDAYGALKGLLNRLAPTFDADAVDAQDAEEKQNELAERLASLSLEELDSLARVTADLAKAADAEDLAENLVEFAQVINIEDVEAKKQVSIKLRTRANERIATKVKGIKTDEDFSFDFDSTKS